MFTITRDGVYYFILTIESKNDKNDFNASVHIEMKGTYGFLSAVDWPLLPVFCIQLSFRFFFRNPTIVSVLRNHVFSVCRLWYHLANRIIYAMARFASNTILDWWCHFAWNVGKGNVLCGIPKHQFQWCVRKRCCSCC